MLQKLEQKLEFMEKNISPTACVVSKDYYVFQMFNVYDFSIKM